MTGVPAFSVHAASWAAVLAATAGYAALIRSPRHRVTHRQAWCFLGAMGVLLGAITWPLADLAADRLLVALVVQRLLFLLAVPPLLLAGIPRSFVASATRPAAVDRVARTCSEPIPAIAIVAVIAVGTLSVPVVDAQASSAALRAALDLLLVGAGLVLWLPVLQPLPGTRRRSSLGRAGYLVVQSIVPSFLSIVWIFARHPIYPVYAHRDTVLGLGALADQELSGFVAKLTTIAVLWTVAFVTVVHAERMAEGSDPEPLTWADVERQLQRVARRERRGSGPPRDAWGDRSGGGDAGSAARRRRRAAGDDAAGGAAP